LFSISGRFIPASLASLAGEADATEDGGVLEGVEADLGLAELLDQVEEVFGEVGLEGDDELLVVQAEGVGGVELDAGVEQGRCGCVRP